LGAWCGRSRRPANDAAMNAGLEAAGAVLSRLPFRSSEAPRFHPLEPWPRSPASPLDPGGRVAGLGRQPDSRRRRGRRPVTDGHCRRGNRRDPRERADHRTRQHRHRHHPGEVNRRTHRVVLETTLRDVTAKSGFAVYDIRTGTRKYSVLQRLGKDKSSPALSFYRANGDRVRRPEVERSVDRADNRATVEMPRSCLGGPEGACRGRYGEARPDGHPRSRSSPTTPCKTPSSATSWC